MAGLLTWSVTHILLQAAVYGTFDLPMYAATWRLWLLPMAWATALALGMAVAGGGGLPRPLLRVVPFMGLGWLYVRDAPGMIGAPAYTLWMLLWVTLGVGLGLGVVRRRERQRRATARNWAAI